MEGVFRFMSCVVLLFQVARANRIPRHDAPEEDFYLTKVTKEEFESYYNVRLEYEASRKPTRVLLKPSFFDASYPIDLEDSVDGVLDFQVSKGNDRDNHWYMHPQISLLYPEQIVTLELSLNAAQSTMDVPRIRLHVAQGNDVTFRHAHDVELDVTWKVEVGDPEIIRDDFLYYDLIMRNESEPHTVDRFDSPVRVSVLGNGHLPVWFELEARGGTKGDRWERARLNSMVQDPRGVLYIKASVRFNRSHGYPVNAVHTGTTVAFYNEQHSGPFPPDFLGFIRRPQTLSDPSTFYCDARPRYGLKMPCNIHCQATGSGATTTQILPLTRNVDVMNTKAVMEYGGGYSSAAEFWIDDVRGSHSADYVCIARSASADIATSISLIVFESPDFDENASYVTHMENGSIAARCVAEGNPSPGVIFNTDTWPLSDDTQAYDVTMTRESETRTRADIIVTDPSLASSLSSFECRAQNVGDNGEFRYSAFDAYLYTMRVNNTLNTST